MYPSVKHFLWITNAATTPCLSPLQEGSTTAACIMIHWVTQHRSHTYSWHWNALHGVSYTHSQYIIDSLKDFLYSAAYKNENKRRMEGRVNLNELVIITNKCTWTFRCKCVREMQVTKPESIITSICPRTCCFYECDYSWSLYIYTDTFIYIV